MASTPCFEVASLEGKGFGVIALRNIVAGELILAERPTLNVSLSNHDDNEEQFEALSEPDQQRVMSLHDACIVRKTKTLRGIIGANALCRGSDTRNGAVLCDVISRLNHSCSPNCDHSWNENASEMQIYAATDVCIGDELCIYYRDIRETKVERAYELWDVYRFRCSCSVCNSVDTSSIDSRRSRMLELDEEIRAVGAERGIPMVAELLALYDQEGIHLHSLRGQACFYAFQLHLATGNLLEAKPWIEKTYEHRKMCHGPHHVLTLEALAFVEKPESYPAYQVWLDGKS